MVCGTDWNSSSLSCESMTWVAYVTKSSVIFLMHAACVSLSHPRYWLNLARMAISSPHNKSAHNFSQRIAEYNRPIYAKLCEAKKIYNSRYTFLLNVYHQIITRVLQILFITIYFVKWEMKRKLKHCKFKLQ